jgi:hypothetical protein
LAYLTITLCMCIGSAVAWLIAIYTPDGAYDLIWNVFFGMVGAALCALVLVWTFPVFVIIGVLVAGPLCALLAIVGGTAIRRACSR